MCDIKTGEKHPFLANFTETSKVSRTISEPRTGYSNADLKACHATIAADVELPEFAAMYTDFVSTKDLSELSVRQLLEFALKEDRWSCIAASIARVIAATHHFCDVKRLLPAYNRVKTIDHSSLAPETLNDYLHIMITMPTFAEFNV